MRLTLLILAMPLAIILTGLLWFASLWTAHQEDHAAEFDDREEPHACGSAL